MQINGWVSIDSWKLGETLNRPSIVRRLGASAPQTPLSPPLLVLDNAEQTEKWFLIILPLSRNTVSHHFFWSRLLLQASLERKKRKSTSLSFVFEKKRNVDKLHQALIFTVCLLLVPEASNTFGNVKVMTRRAAIIFTTPLIGYVCIVCACYVHTGEQRRSVSSFFFTFLFRVILNS